MKKLIAALGVVSLLTATAAFAADTAPLPSGKPSGVHKAQDIMDNTPLLVGLGVAAIVGVVIATNDDDNTSTSTATATST
jgi:hypothetical protein